MGPIFLIRRNYRPWPSSCWVILLLLAVTGPRILAQRPTDLRTAPEQTAPIKVQASPLYKTLDQFVWDHPNASQDQVAQFANARLQEFGINFDFDIAGSIGRNKPEARSQGVTDIGGEAPYDIELQLLGGGHQTFLISVGDDGPCGERIVTLPIVAVTRHSILLAVKGRQYRIRRPTSFALDVMELVDAGMRKPLHRWEVPYESTPAGVSADGATLYLEGFSLSYGKHLWLAISDKGLELVPSATLADQSSAEMIEHHPTDPRNAYLSFMRFIVRGKPMIIRFSAPCT